MTFLRFVYLNYLIIRGLWVIDGFGCSLEAPEVEVHKRLIYPIAECFTF